ncbi:MAG: DUF1572 domain-containing protein [Phycisphaerae bacterium]|nr:hypothetical protein [Phycisphaerales bacterium]
MNIPQQIARHFREMHEGQSMTGVHLYGLLEGVTFEQATATFNNFHTIAEQVYHINYYISAVLKVLQGGPLDAHDKFSWDCPVINSESDWQQLQNKCRSDAEVFAKLVEAMPEEKLQQDFADPKYGNWHRNLTSILEHSHYHLGQIALTKKLVMTR